MEKTDAENWLLGKLKYYGVDVYVDGEFASLRDRLAHVIVNEDIQGAPAGRRNRCPESFGTVFERIYGVEIESIAPRGTHSKAEACDDVF